MKRRPYSDELGRSLVRFFQDYLPTLRGMSRHTIHSYRDTLVLLLRFLSARRHCGIERLDFAALRVFFESAATKPFATKVQSAPLRDVEALWNAPERSARLVFQP